MAANGGIKVVFHGVRGSYPAPGSDFVIFGGNTACQEIRAGGRLVIFDAGTGLIGLGRKLLNRGVPPRAALFLSHCHHDHLGGLLYFKPAYLPATRLSIYGPRNGNGGIRGELEKISGAFVHPVPLREMGMEFTCDQLEGGESVVWSPGEDRPRLERGGAGTAPGDVVVRVLNNSRHPRCGVLNFRLEYAGRSYVYATDVEGDEETGDPELADFARGADLMSHDGQYTSEEYRSGRRGWGHSTPLMAIRTAQLAGVGRLAIIHHDPEYRDVDLLEIEAEAKALFPDVFLVREGQEEVID
ncbi:MAG: MBL fold metallo-hydrolase [Planctomycetota bacterium]|jgi:phosphoribosyl 1,2-cyclic phosphodiesterase|nr:MBL fold metallo-hydrolase [Planctomycetota bacterium]